MKEFAFYTALRLLLFLATLAVVLGVWAIVAGTPNLFLSAIIALLISGIAGVKILDAPRRAFAARVDERARKAATKYEEMRAREDVD
ncbi:DUF4229 domain-containing protein [Nocardioides sp. GY 10127]|uniref:DUF4229 domain-containing protein n=1 Tax=Nocardioides sp. GY 10127 TaxID=2569762 RepID=UPI0014585EBB|nr:DUF4229 domain-containing protein [Nocardioides sp. GY 10127]